MQNDCSYLAKDLSEENGRRVEESALKFVCWGRGDVSLVKKLQGFCGVQNLDEIKHLEMILDSETTAIEQTLRLLPSLRRLTLDQSRISSLRDIGVNMRNLKTISLSYVGLCDLDGIGLLSNVSEIRLSHNNIRDLTPLAMHERIEILDLSHNAIDDLSSLELLATCPILTALDIRRNPLAESDAHYRHRLSGCIPQLRVLDGRHIKLLNAGRNKVHLAANDIDDRKTKYDEGENISEVRFCAVEGKTKNALWVRSCEVRSETLNKEQHSAVLDTETNDSVSSRLVHCTHFMAGNAAMSLRRRRSIEIQSSVSVASSDDGSISLFEDDTDMPFRSPGARCSNAAGIGTKHISRRPFSANGSTMSSKIEFERRNQPVRPHTAVACRRPRLTGNERCFQFKDTSFVPCFRSDTNLLTKGKHITQTMDCNSDSSQSHSSDDDVIVRSDFIDGASDHHIAARSHKHCQKWQPLKNTRTDKIDLRSSLANIIISINCNDGDSSDDCCDSNDSVLNRSAVESEQPLCESSSVNLKFDNGVSKRSHSALSFSGTTQNTAPANGAHSRLSHPNVSCSESTHRIGSSNKLSDDELISMLRRQPKEVPQINTREAYRSFFTGMKRQRMEHLLREANRQKDTEDLEHTVKKRLGLLNDVLAI